VASDLFNSDSNPLASPWATVGSLNQLKALSGVCQPVTASSDSSMRYGTSSELISVVEIGSVGDADGGPALCLSSGANGYFCTRYDGNMHLFRMDTGSFTEINAGGASAVTFGVGGLIRMRRVSNSILIDYDNGGGYVNVRTETETTHMTGNPGIFLFGTITANSWNDGAGGAAAYNAAPLLQYYQTLKRGGVFH
jgi:hypothetical protein